MTYDAKYPMILPNNDNNVNALIRHRHYQLAHATVNHTYHALRDQYYIIGRRTTVSEVLRFCIPCQKLDKAPMPQKEGPLPKDRIELVKPFRPNWRQAWNQSHSQKVGSSSDMHGHASDLFAAAQGHVHANTYQCSREVS